MLGLGMVWYGKTLFKHASLNQRQLLFMRGVTQINYLQVINLYTSNKIVKIKI